MVVEAGQRRSSGREVTVRLNAVVPGPDIELERRIGRSDPAADVKLATREAFDAERRTILERKSRRGP